ncbi:hypothetical protein [Paenibacillus sp. PL2-23]|uniref:hypothetical protein n=1 Tax=Paenibacillus sp. PL2-23 TaxID=2100729 RepID=UPI0030FCF2A9
MFGWCCKVVVVKNQGTIIFGNIKEYAPSTNSVTSGESSGSEQGSENTEAGVSGRSSRKRRRGGPRVCRKKLGKQRVLRGRTGKSLTYWTCGE